MKKLMSLVAAVLFAGAVFACDAPSGYTERQTVTSKKLTDNGNVSEFTAVIVYQATNACDAFCVCHFGSIYYVSRSDRSGYRFVYWDAEGKAWYFNM